MITFDIVAIAVIGLMTLKGFSRGLISEIIGMTPWILALVLTGYLAPSTTALISKFATTAIFGIVTTSATLFTGFATTFLLANRQLMILLTPLVPFFLSNALGATLGAIKGFFIMSLVVLVSAMITTGFSSEIKESVTAAKVPSSISSAKTFEILASGASLLASAIPDQAFAYFGKFKAATPKDTDTTVETIKKEIPKND